MDEALITPDQMLTALGEAVRFDPSQPRAPAGTVTGGQFSASGGQAGGAAAEKQRLLARAKADRAEAHRLQAQLRKLEGQHAAAVKAAKHHATQAKAAAAAAGKNPTQVAKAHQAAAKAQHHQRHRHHAAQHKTHTAHAASLTQRIAHLKTRIGVLLDTAKRLEARAGRIAVRFDPSEPRGFHGKWISVGASAFAYDGPAGGGGHVRSIMAVADVIAREPGGVTTAANIRDSAKAMYARDMPSAYRHLDGAAYNDSISGGPSHRDDIEAIRASYAEVPHSATPNTAPAQVPPELSTGQHKLKGRPVPAGVTGSYSPRPVPVEAHGYAGRAFWNPRQHPRDKHGEFATKAAGDLETLAAELHQDEMAEAMLGGTFKLDSPSAYHKVHHHLREAAKALRKGDAETAREHLRKAKEHLLKLPGHAARKHAPTVDKRLEELGKAITGAGVRKPPKPRGPVLSPQQMMLGALMGAGMQRDTETPGMDWDPVEYLLLRVSYDPRLHPHLPAGGPHGGEFASTPGGGGEFASTPGGGGGSRRPVGWPTNAPAPPPQAPGGEPTVGDLANMVADLRQQLAAQEPKLRTEYGRQLHDVVTQMRGEEAKLAKQVAADEKLADLKIERRKALIRTIATVLGLVAVGLLVIATEGLALPALALAGVAVGPLIGGEAIAALGEAHARRRTRARISGA